MRWRNGSGMTLVELVVILAIIGVLAAAAYSSLGNILQVTESKGAAEQVAAAIRLARQYAITRGTRHCVKFTGTPNTAFRIQEAPDNTSCTGINVHPPAGITPDTIAIGHGLAILNPTDLSIIFDGVGNVKNMSIIHDTGNPTQVTVVVDTNPHTCENDILVTLYGGVRVTVGAC